MELKNLTVSDFAAITASDAPAPGGGSVSALCGALAASLAEMVANLTSGREKYAQVQPQVEEVLQQYPAIRARLLDAIDRDSKAFDLYMAALAMPKTTDAEKAARKRAMQEGLKAAALVPMETAETALTVFPALRLAVEQGNANAITDGMVGTMLARTAVLGAVFNVRVNLSSIQDSDFTDQLTRRADQAQSDAIAWERSILGKVSLAGAL